MKTFLFLILLLSALTVQSAEIEQSIQHDLQDIKKVLIFNGDGAVRITAQEGIEQIHGKYFIRASGTAAEVKQHIAQQMRFYHKIEKNKLVLKSGYDKSTKKSKKKAQVDIELLVPKHVFVDVRSGNGTIKLTKLASGVRLLNKKGDITLVNSSGFISINDTSGDIHLKDNNGKVKINDSKGDIIVDRHQGELIINDKKGDIHLANTKGKIRIVDGSGDIAIGPSNGLIKVIDKKGEIFIDNNQGNVKIKSKSGLITTKNIAGNVVIESKNHQDIITEAVSGKVTLN